MKQRRAFGQERALVQEMVDMETEDVDHETTLKISIRILEIKEPDLSCLRTSALPHRIGKHFKTKEPTASFCIYSTRNKPEILANIGEIHTFLVDQKIDLDNVDLFVSMVSGSACNMLDVPVCVSDVVTRIGCRVVWSYTIV